MRAVVFEKSGGGPSALKLVEVDSPQLGDDQVLIKVAAAAVNRMDVDQRLNGVCITTHPGGLFCPGVECSGHIKAVGPGVTRWKVGDRVCALLSNGGYAEEVAVSSRLVLPVPSNVPLTYAASLPEAACNAWQVVSLGNLGPGKRLLIHECYGDIGLFTLQVAKYKGALVYITAGSDEKLDLYKHHGADICINCKNEDFVSQVMERTDNRGVHVVVASSAVNFRKDLKILGFGGILLLLDFHGPLWADLTFTELMRKCAKIQVLNRWNKKLDTRASIVDSVRNEVWPAIENGSVRPLVYKIFQMSEAAAAHKLMVGAHIFQNIFSVVGVYVSRLRGQFYTHKVVGHILGKILLVPDPTKS